MLDRLGTEGGQLLDVHHNLVTRAEVQGERGWLHCKGATPSDGGLVVIRLARRLQLSGGAGSQPGQPLLAGAWRGPQVDAQRVQDRLFKRYSPAQLKTRLGSHVICEDKQLIYEEAPEAYKPVDSIIASLEQAGLLTVLAKLRPVLTYKTRRMLLMILLQLSSAQGPDECCLAVAKALARLSREAQARSVDVDIVESESGGKAGTYRSVLLSLDGDGAASLAASWEGSIQWTCPSPYRPSHPRKNWFIGVLRCEAPAPSLAADIRFETTRSSGPGGQHVNKTESAVRATHVATGISVKVQTERSQHANKRLAVLLIAHRLASHEQARDAAQRARRRQFHHEVGAAVQSGCSRAPPSSRPTARSPRPGVLHRRETAGTRVTGRFSNGQPLCGRRTLYREASLMPVRPWAAAGNELRLIARHRLAETIALPVLFGLLDAILAAGHEVPPEEAGTVQRFAAQHRVASIAHRADLHRPARREHDQAAAFEHLPSTSIEPVAR